MKPDIPNCPQRDALMLQAQGPLTRIFRRYPRIRVFAVRFNDRRNIPPTASSEPTLGRQPTPSRRWLLGSGYSELGYVGWSSFYSRRIDVQFPASRNSERAMRSRKPKPQEPTATATVAFHEAGHALASVLAFRAIGSGRRAIKY